MFKLNKIYEIIVSECQNGCVDYESTMDYFYQHYVEIFLPEEVHVVASNFDYITTRIAIKKEMENANR